MNKTIMGMSFLLLLSACSEHISPPLTSGIDRDGMNLQVRPQDDFYED